jgi:hypothetical protein
MPTDLENLIFNGLSVRRPASAPLSDEELYWHMHELGKSRFGSECKHEQTKDGYCVVCLRRVIVR